MKFPSTKFLDKFPTSMRSLNIAISLLLLIFIISAIVIVLIVAANSSSREDSRLHTVQKPSMQTVQPRQQSVETVQPVSDVLVTQLQSKENDLIKSTTENAQLKQNMKVFADSIDKNFSTLQSQMSGMNNRLYNVEKTVNQTIIEKQSIKIIRLDKTPYKRPVEKETPRPKKGKVLAQVGNVVWIDSTQK